jgi:predicted nucleotidyltransferase
MFKCIAMSQDINDKIVNYLKRFNPRRIGIFGSYAREEDTPQSDIDILIDFTGQVTLFDLGGIKYDLTEILNRPVDIVTEKGINKHIRDNIYKDLKIIFG